MEDELSDEQRGQGLEILRRAKIGMTGQNLVWVTEITAVRGILGARPEAGRGGLPADRRRDPASRRGEGIQPDFSFHQHGPCLYSHGYGAAFAVDCSRDRHASGRARGWPFRRRRSRCLSHLLLDGSQWMARGSVVGLRRRRAGDLSQRPERRISRHRRREHAPTADRPRGGVSSLGGPRFGRSRPAAGRQPALLAIRRDDASPRRATTRRPGCSPAASPTPTRPATARGSRATISPTAATC